MRMRIILTGCMVLGISAAGAVCRAGTGLSDAYDKELAILNAEKSALEKVVLELEQGRAAVLSPMREEIDRLSHELTRLRVDNEKKEDRLGKAKESLAAVSDDTSVVDTLFSQVRRTYQMMGLSLPQEAERPAEEILDHFSAALGKLRTQGSIRVEKGEYFDAEGKRRTGDILWISRVSAASLDKAHGGRLAAAGKGVYKVVQRQTDDALTRYRQQGEMMLAKVTLFDPLAEDVGAAAAHKTLLETFLSGGIVMWPILLLGVLSLLILLERIVSLNKVHTNADRLMKKVGEHIFQKNWEAAKNICVRNAGAVAQVLETILRHKDRPRDQQEELVYESILSQKPKLERFLSLLNIIAAAAPLLGLLGTVTGMIGTFEVITTHGTGDPKILSGGISEALLTTELGLIVAIPALFFHAILSSRVDHIMGDMETNGIRLLNRIHCPEQKNDAAASKSGDCIAV
jgi:biopolymer transport protein ExbB